MHLLFVLDEEEKNSILQINKHFYHDVYVSLSKEGGNIPLFQTEGRIMRLILVVKLKWSEPVRATTV
jgi:hypothetical protein